MLLGLLCQTFNFIYLYNVVAKNVFNSILNKDPYL